MQKIAANPKDIVSLQSLADIYYRRGRLRDRQRLPREDRRHRPEERDRAARPRRRALQPRQDRRGREAVARGPRRSTPDNLEAHYDLGFMYLSLTPPDIANVRAEWGKVVAIAPDSDVAKTVASAPRQPRRARPPERRRPSRPAPAAPAGPEPSPVPSPGRVAGTERELSDVTAGIGRRHRGRLRRRDRVVRLAVLPAARPGLRRLHGRDRHRRRAPPTVGARAFYQALAFVVGFSAVFIALWASVGLIGYVLRDYVGDPPPARRRDPRLHGPPRRRRHRRLACSIARSTSRSARWAAPRWASAAAAPATPSYRRSALLGVVFAAGWTPCIGPILGGIIGLAVGQRERRSRAPSSWSPTRPGWPSRSSSSRSAPRAVSHRLGWFRDHHRAVSLVTGAMLVVVGFLMITNTFGRLSGLFAPLGLLRSSAHERDRPTPTIGRPDPARRSTTSTAASRSRRPTSASACGTSSSRCGRASS